MKLEVLNHSLVPTMESKAPELKFKLNLGQFQMDPSTSHSKLWSSMGTHHSPLYRLPFNVMFWMDCLPLLVICVLKDTLKQTLLNPAYPLAIRCQLTTQLIRCQLQAERDW